VADAVGEWVEMHNPSDEPIDVRGWVLRDEGKDKVVLASPWPLLVPGHGFLAVGGATDVTVNGGASLAFGWTVAGQNPPFGLDNGAKDAVVVVWNGVVIDQVVYQPKGSLCGEPNEPPDCQNVGFPVTIGASMTLDPGHLNATDNGDATLWCEAKSALPGGDKGTPGAANDSCNLCPPTGCCTVDTDCDDKNDCTTDTCDIGAEACVFTEVKGCCNVDSDCDDGDNLCTLDTCSVHKCGYAPTNAPGCCVPELWSNAFDGGDLKGMQLSNSAGAAKGWQLWANASPAKSAPGALYYGYPATMSFDFGSSSGTARTPVVALPMNQVASARFWLYVDTEADVSYDRLEIAPIVNGAKGATLWTKGSAGFSLKGWMDVTLSLAAYKGKQVQLEFSFNSIDSLYNTGRGVLVDDLRILVACP
jgi:hypothetical protein